MREWGRERMRDKGIDRGREIYSGEERERDRGGVSKGGRER